MLEVMYACMTRTKTLFTAQKHRCLAIPFVYKERRANLMLCNMTASLSTLRIGGSLPHNFQTSNLQQTFQYEGDLAE
jgi:hypothetical protein